MVISELADTQRNMRKVALTSLAGTSIEWYDFFIFGIAAATVFPAIFFPEDMPYFTRLIASFSAFAVAFIARPIGAMCFGHFGDRVGRKAALVTALMMMGIATTIIGFLPTYAAIGPMAPILLTLLRFTQGLAVGGQWGGAMLLVTENAPENKRGFYGAFAQAGGPVGVILANLAFLSVTMITTDEQFISWGWRLPFLASVALIGISLYVQLTLEDTQAFKALKKTKVEDGDEEKIPESTIKLKGSPVWDVVARYPKQIACASGAAIGLQVTFYIQIVWIFSYTTGLEIPRSTVLAAVLIASLCFQLPGIFLSASYSDRHGRRGIYMAGAVLGGLWPFALFTLVGTGSFLWIAIALGVGQLFLSMMYGPQAAFLSELFSTEVRYSGTSLSYQIGAILGGGVAPIIATFLLRDYGIMYVAAYIAFAHFLTFICVLLLTETKGADLDNIDGSDVTTKREIPSFEGP